MYILRASRLVDGTGTGGAAGMIVVDKDLIVYAGPQQGFTGNTAGAEILDFGDATLMPGMIDAHVHTSFNGEPDYWDIVLKQTESFRTLTSLRNVQSDLAAGFTTLRVLGEKSHLDIALRNAINRGIVTGPRLVCAGQNITVSSGHADIWLVPDIKYEQGLGGVIVDGPDAVRRATRQQIKAGADLIKLLVTGGIMSEGSEPGLQHMSEEEMLVAVSEAHRIGKRVSAHAQGTRGIKSSVRNGIDSIEHGFYLDHEGATMMAGNGTFFVPTLAAGATMTSRTDQVPAYVVRKSLEAQRSAANAVRLALDAGARIVTGTDAGSPYNYHGDNAQELELLVKAGMSEAQVIAAATQVAAQCLGIEHQVGTLEPGKQADIICVKGDPLKDISACRRVSFVMKGGQVVVSGGRPLFRA